MTDHNITERKKRKGRDEKGRERKRKEEKRRERYGEEVVRNAQSRT
jgi:hypothetical protein